MISVVSNRIFCDEAFNELSWGRLAVKRRFDGIFKLGMLELEHQFINTTRIVPSKGPYQHEFRALLLRILGWVQDIDIFGFASGPRASGAGGE